MGVVLAPCLAFLGEAAAGYASGHFMSPSSSAGQGEARQRCRLPASASGEQEMGEEEGNFGFVFVNCGEKVERGRRVNLTRVCGF